ncbi:MAG: beta-ketoacyl-[acyl-carrier-protein] synthase family protein [Chloroflexota bacterium]|nr:beta-ketoacyl-[acyl-carrier-protein] synthase family protein [Chloroflexota bacterium]
MSGGQNGGRQRVVVTGLGAVSPLGCSVDSLWEGLLAGRSGAASITDFDLSNCRTRIGARVSGYDPGLYFSYKELKRLSLTSQFVLVAVDEALKSADLDANECDPQGVGVILGGSSGGFAAVEPHMERFFIEKTVRDPLTIPTIMNNAPASNVSIRFGFKGPLMTIDAACSSAAHAIGYAFNLIRCGLLPMAITGAGDSSLCASLIHAWSNLRALSERNDTPQESCRPFSLDRDGMVLGEGAGILILESESSALKRGARILAEITGYAATSDSHHLTQPALDGIGQTMQLALADAGLSPGQVDYINAHATATLWNDKTETAAIKNVFGPSAGTIPVVGIKAAIGHSIAASGALELISCVLSIRDGILPPTLNLKVPDPECDLDYVSEGARTWEVTHAISNSFAFGGSNAVLVVSRYDRPS